MNDSPPFSEFAEALESALAVGQIASVSNVDDELYKVACAMLDAQAMPLFADVDAVILNTLSRSDDTVSAKMAFEVGTALLLDKPLVVLTTHDAAAAGLPGQLADLASVIVTLDNMDDPMEVSRAIELTLEQMADRGMIVRRDLVESDSPEG